MLDLMRAIGVLAAADREVQRLEEEIRGWRATETPAPISLTVAHDRWLTRRNEAEMNAQRCFRYCVKTYGEAES